MVNISNLEIDFKIGFNNKLSLSDGFWLSTCLGKLSTGPTFIFNSEIGKSLALKKEGEYVLMYLIELGWFNY